MRNADNDNTELSFITLGAATLNVMRFLEGSKEQQTDRERNATDQDTKQDKTSEHAKAVDEGLRRIREFERRYRRGGDAA